MHSPFLRLCYLYDDAGTDDESLPVVTSLLQRGANPMAFTNDGVTPLIIASRNGDRPLTIGALLDACDDAAHIDHKDEDGCTALWYACFFGYASSVRVLVSRGANWMIAGKVYGRAPLSTPMEIARQRGHHDCVEHIEVGMVR